jgi:LL-diaminopimelate aminotransferase
MIKTANRIASVEEYYFSRKLAEVRGLDSPEHRVINLGIGSPDQNTASSILVLAVLTRRLPSMRLMR